MSSSRTEEEEHKNNQEIMVKAHTMLEFTLENLQLLDLDKGPGSIFPDAWCENIISLSEDLKYIRNFIKRVQETPQLKPKVSELVTDIEQQIFKLLVSTDIHVKKYLVKSVVNFDQGGEGTSSFDDASLLAKNMMLISEYLEYLTRKMKSIEGLEKMIRDGRHLVKLSNPENYDDRELASNVLTTLENIGMLLSLRNFNLIIEREKVLSFHKNVEYLSSLFTKMQDNVYDIRYPSIKITDLWVRVKECFDYTTLEMYRNIESSVLVDFSPLTRDLVQKIKAVEQDVLVDGSPNEGEPSSRADDLSDTEGKVVIGMVDEAGQLLNRLTRGRRQLQVIQVIGMAGIGKTTLAGKLYNNPSVARYFHVRTWASVSQSYGSRKLLCDILRCIVGDNNPVLSSSEEDIGEKLYKCLRGNRYLIVLDDVWDVQVWNDLQIYLPDDSNSSRVIVTCRNKDVVPEELLSGDAPHFLRLLREDESWDLFRCKVFGSASFCDSGELIQVGKEIVATCKGLPIAIVVLGGLLAKEEKTTENWKKLAKTIRSSANIMDILDLSYRHLPFQLKSCFLFLGSFPEDYEFPVKWLIRAWIAQGFIELPTTATGDKELEDVAEGYIMNLINRSLLVVASRRSDGGIKSCQIHDLLRDLCIKKSVEKNFLQPICRCGSSSNAKPFPNSPSFSDCHYFHSYDSHFDADHMLVDKDYLTVLQFLRVLDLGRVAFYKFPKKVCELSHLKYLALRVGRIKKLPHSIFELWNLETFILEGEKGGRVELVTSITKMMLLRHFHVSQELFCDPMSWLNLDLRHQLCSLQSISNVSASDSSLESLLSRTPNLRKLGLHATISKTNENVAFPTLSNLKVLETLKFEYQTLGMKPFTIRSLDDFPQSLKKLTLIGSYVDWSAISIIARLPNLEVLKLEDNFFHGHRWETSDDGFESLKLLKLSHMDLKQWICSSACHFPKLEQLVINGCLDLEEIPEVVGYIPTLHTIKVYKSSESVVEAAREIQETQINYGNSAFKVFIFLHFQ